ncbi:MAG: hypothetical protein ACJAYE_002032 [Candidatus Azotimanducaceae bacterium]|jgi:hypothetical protein
MVERVVEVILKMIDIETELIISVTHNSGQISRTSG